MATIKTLLGYVKGPKGDTGETGGTGPAGAAATVEAGMVNNVAYGQPARVTNVGTPHAAVFNFDIPEGRPGSIGEISGYPVNAITTQAGDFPIPNVGDTIASIVGKQAKATADAKAGIQTAMSNASDALDAATAASASIANILGDFATIEPTATASKAYEIGKRLVLNGLYYKVTAAISQGDQLVVDGNIEKTTVGDDITALSKDLAISTGTITKVGNYYSSAVLNKAGGLKRFQITFSQAADVAILPQGAFTKIAQLPSDFFPVTDVRQDGSSANSNGIVITQVAVSINRNGEVLAYNYFNTKPSITITVVYF